MLKLDRLVHRTAFFLALSLFAAPLTPAQAEAALGAADTPPRLSPASFAVLDAQAKMLYLKGIIAHWQTFADGRDFAFVQSAVDSIVTPAGDLRVPPAEAQPFGQAILLSYRVSGNPALYQAAKQLRDSLQTKQDKADSSSAPFLADFGVTFGDAPAAEQAADILLRIDTSERDLETGLLKGSDLSRNSFYALDLLGTIDRLPLGFHHRRGLVEALNKTISALVATHENRAVWQTPGQPARTLQLNAYIVAHAVRLGELAEGDAALARNMAEVAHSASLTETADGARLLAESEEDQAPTQNYGQGTTVVVDGWFDSEVRKNPAGGAEVAHSKWDDETDLGLSFMANAVTRYGMQPDTLHAAPTEANLSSAQIYVIDIENEIASHEVTEQDQVAIQRWVKDGGVLVLMAAETEKRSLSTLNSIADRFGMHFSPATPNRVENTTTGPTLLSTPSGDSVFPKSRRLFVQGNLGLTLTPLAHPALKNGNEVVMAVTSVGRGTVLTIANPWLLNRYLDGRKDQLTSDNFHAAIDLAGWLLKQTQQ